jgi:hypothetical protein
MLPILEFIMMACGMVGCLAISFARWWGYYFLLVGAAVGIYWSYEIESVSLVVLHAFYIGVNINGIWGLIYKKMAKQ